jgi:hypothetical protein
MVEMSQKMANFVRLASWPGAGRLTAGCMVADWQFALRRPCFGGGWQALTNVSSMNYNYL